MTKTPKRPPVVSLATLAVLAVALASGFVEPLPAGAQEVTWRASVRSRLESRNIHGGDSSLFTGMQTRLSVAREIGDQARIFVQLQDARLWGSETSTGDGSADLFDLHQGYFEMGQREGDWWVRVGRQEMQFAEGRLVGTPPWSNVGQSFDGVRAAWAPTASTTVDVFGTQIREADAGDLVPESTFLGVWSETRVGDGGSFQLFALHDHVHGAARTARTTLGTYFASTSGRLSYRVEGALQGGKAAGLDVNASMLALRAGWSVDDGDGEVTLWYDRYSGDANPDAGTTGAFSELFARKHRFFGYADLLKHIPADTRGRGLQDVALKLSDQVRAETTVGLDVHRFLVADDTGLGSGKLADELDLYARGPVVEGVDFLTGLTWVGLGEAGRAVELAAGNVVFTYVQLRAAF